MSNNKQYRLYQRRENAVMALFHYSALLQAGSEYTALNLYHSFLVAQILAEIEDIEDEFDELQIKEDDEQK